MKKETKERVFHIGIDILMFVCLILMTGPIFWCFRANATIPENFKSVAFCMGMFFLFSIPFALLGATKLEADGFMALLKRQKYMLSGSKLLPAVTIFFHLFAMVSFACIAIVLYNYCKGDITVWRLCSELIGVLVCFATYPLFVLFSSNKSVVNKKEEK